MGLDQRMLRCHLPRWCRSDRATCSRLYILQTEGPSANRDGRRPQLDWGRLRICRLHVRVHPQTELPYGGAAPLVVGRAVDSFGRVVFQLEPRRKPTCKSFLSVRFLDMAPPGRDNAHNMFLDGSRTATEKRYVHATVCCRPATSGSTVHFRPRSSSLSRGFPPQHPLLHFR